MSTVESSEQQARGPESVAAPRHGWVTTALIALAALLIGLGAGWLAFSPEQPDDVDREIQALIDDFVAAWNVQDGQAVVALMTEDGMHFSGGAANGKEASSDSPAHSLAYFVEHHVAGATFRSVNDAVIHTEDGPPYLAANVIEIGNGSDGGDAFQSVEVYKIVPVDGVLKIQVHTALIGGLD